MSKRCELKKIDEEAWEATPNHIREMRKRFSFLRDEITKSSKKIERHKKNINKLKKAQKENEIEKKDLCQKLVTFQVNILNIPTVSPTFQKGINNQWSINLTIGDIQRKKYLGSNRKVRERLDEIKDVDYYTTRINSIDDWNKECRVEIQKIIHRNIVAEINDDVLNIFNKWKNNELKMWDYFY